MTVPSNPRRSLTFAVFGACRAKLLDTRPITINSFILLFLSFPLFSYLPLAITSARFVYSRLSTPAKTQSWLFPFSVTKTSNFLSNPSSVFYFRAMHWPSFMKVDNNTATLPFVLPTDLHSMKYKCNVGPWCCCSQTSFNPGDDSWIPAVPSIESGDGGGGERWLKVKVQPWSVIALWTIPVKWIWPFTQKHIRT